MEDIITVEVPIPKELVEIAKSRGVSAERLAAAAQKLLITEVVAMESKLSMKDALNLGKKVNEGLWKTLQ